MDSTEIKQALIHKFLQSFPSESAEILNNASGDKILNYLHEQPIQVSKEIFSKLDREVSSHLLEEMDDSFFVQLLEQLDP